mgnify:CR=1 FL=1
MNAIYNNDKIALINFTRNYYESVDEILSSDNFREILRSYLHTVRDRDFDMARWAYRGQDEDMAVTDLVRLAKILYVFDMKEIDNDYLGDKGQLVAFVEGLYNYWRTLHRCTMIVDGDSEGLQRFNFVEADTKYNQLILTMYRRIEENVKGRKNNVYRQLNAGSNASIVVKNYGVYLPKQYEKLKTIPFIESIMLRTPLLLHPASNKREGVFTERKSNPVRDFEFDPNKWLCYPAKVGKLVCFFYFHIDYLFSALSMANLFELASERECYSPDLIVLFGNEDGKEEITYYYDKKNDIYVGNVSYRWKVEYFGYIKKMILTVHNLKMMRYDYLPLHGSMINITLKDGTRKGIVFIGDSGAGKSETIEAMQHLENADIADYEVIFDDMGALHEENGNVYATGTEIGAFVRLDDLDRSTAYRELDRSIFFNPETSNSRLVLPIISYEKLNTNQKVDMFLYANNYEMKNGLHAFSSWQEAKAVFVEGKRYALGTTQEIGVSTTYFANPFGPMQESEMCDKLIDRMFSLMEEKGILLGEAYTHLGCPDKSVEVLKKAAAAILEEVKK